MPGANCSIFGCSSSRNDKGLAIFHIPSKDDEYSISLRKKWINVITKDRVIDKDLKTQIEKRNLHVCKLHFPEDKIVHRK